MPPAKRSSNRLQRDAYTLTIRQSPEIGKALGSKEKDRKPIDPPPIVQLQIRDLTDPAHPYYICAVYLLDPVEDDWAKDNELYGSLSSSLHRLKESDNTDAGFFVFPDLSVKSEGEVRLRFVLWEYLEGEFGSHQQVTSKPFRVHPAKTFPGLAESTFLTRSLSDQGVRLRIRKETRSALKRTVSEAENAHYASQNNASGLGGAYGQGNAYQTGSYSVDYPQAMTKRSKSGEETSYGDRDNNWAQASSSLYAHPSQSQVSGYYQESVSGAPQLEYGFRSAAGTDASLTQSYYQRGALADYSQSSHQLPFHNQPRSTHADVTNGTNGYGDTGSFSSLSGGDTSQHSAYRYNMAGSSMHTLPPISSTSQAGGQGLASPSYSNYGADGRYAGSSRTTYNYPGQAYQASTNFT